MARIVGVDLPSNKRGEIALTYIYGIGRSSARTILEKAGIDFDTKVKDWNDDQLAAVRNVINGGYKVEGELRTSVQMNIKRLMDIGLADVENEGVVARQDVRERRREAGLVLSGYVDLDDFYLRFHDRMLNVQTKLVVFSDINSTFVT